MSHKLKISAVIVLYNQKLNESDSYKSLLKNTTIPVLVYDNSPKIQKHCLPSNFEVVYDTNNSGVSKAYNIAYNWAEKIKSTHLLLLDSDSNFPERALVEYEKFAFENKDSIIFPTLLSEGKKISPFYFYLGRSWYGEDILFGNHTIGRVMAINSGLCIPMSVFKVINGYNENIPLDWSDIDFMKRLKKAKIKAQYIPLKIEHNLSELEQTKESSVLSRFKYKVEALKYVKSSIIEKALMYFWIILKAIKYSVVYKKTSFLKLIFSTLIKW